MSAPSSPEEPIHQLSVHVDFNNLRGKLAQAVDQTARAVSIGFQSSERPINEELRMPGTGWAFTYSNLPPWTEEQARDHFRTWMLRNGLRGVLEAFGSFLDECHDVTAYINLLRKYREQKTLIVQDLFDQQEATQKYQRLGIDKKLEKLKPWSKIPADVQASVRSINRARNILTHHHGVVPASYADEGGAFHLSWFRLQIVTMGEKEREVELGAIVGPGEGVGIRGVKESRSFQPDEPLRIQAKDFSGICWTIFTGGDGLREQIENEWKDATKEPVGSDTGANASGA